jgi:hypothetical protein
VLVINHSVTALYNVMFYNVITYCVTYLKELIEKEDWSPWIHLTKTSNVRHLAMSTTKIVLEWTKAVTFIVTIVFMLLLFGLEQGLQHYQPNIMYAIITWFYYMATEKVGNLRDILIQLKDANLTSYIIICFIKYSTKYMILKIVNV